MADELLKVREVAERLRLNPETVRRWLLSGKLRGVRPGGTKGGWRISVSEVDRVLEREGAAEAGPQDAQPIATL